MGDSAGMGSYRKKVKDAKLKDVILDTNFFVDMFRFRIGFDDIEDAVKGRCDFWVTEQSVKELKGMRIKEAKIALAVFGGAARPKGEAGDAGKTGAAVKLLRAGEKSANADDAIVSLVERLRDAPVKGMSLEGLFVATNDAKLRKRIKALGSRVIYLRARKRLEVG
jgi:rRNA-processing protein FCF1